MRLQLLLPSLLWPTIVGVEVKNLPGLTEPLNFRHYSGYLTASPTHRLHYWFTESQRNPASDPVILWLNGGPGCSSLAGLLTENGPFHVRPDGKTLYLNPYSWNKIANVLFLESPAGVGYSYSTDGDYSTGDYQTAEENYAALKDFYGQFPQFANNSLYLTGESYGGVYIPTLTARVIDGLREFPLNIKGLAVGNGLLSTELWYSTWDKFLYSHGFFGERYNVFAECAVQPSGLATGLMSDYFFTFLSPVGDNTSSVLSQKPVATTPPCLNDTSLQKYLNQENVRKALAIPEHVTNWSICKLFCFYHATANSCPICSHLPYRKEIPEQYLNVYKALNASLRVLVYNGDAGYHKLHLRQDFYCTKKATLIADLVCNFLLGQQFCHNLAIPLVSAKKAWKVDNQIAGFVTRYRNLDFLTMKATATFCDLGEIKPANIWGTEKRQFMSESLSGVGKSRGAGHMVPEDKPKEALEMITAFLSNEPY